MSKYFHEKSTIQSNRQSKKLYLCNFLAGISVTSRVKSRLLDPSLSEKKGQKHPKTPPPPNGQVMVYILDYY